MEYFSLQWPMLTPLGKVYEHAAIRRWLSMRMCVTDTDYLAQRYTLHLVLPCSYPAILCYLQDSHMSEHRALLLDTI